MATIVTTYSTEGFYLYGHRFIETYEKYWPKRDPLVVYADRVTDGARCERRELTAIPSLVEFQKRHAGNLMANGRVPTHVWKTKDIGDGYSFRTDAVKFSNKVFVVREAARQLRRGILVWSDADVVIFGQVPQMFCEDLLKNHDVAYLGRDRTYSECGFLAFRLPEAVPLIERWAAYYETDEVFNLPQTHDSYVFDVTREQMPFLRQLNLTPNGYAHTWVRSPLAVFSDHKKGLRKHLGYSPEMGQRP